MLGNTAILLGGQPLNFNVVNRMREMGMRVVVVDYREKIPLIADAHIVHDAKDSHLGAVLRDLGISSIDFVYTSMDEAGLAQADICREYGLKCANAEALLASHDKGLMHRKWAEAGLLNRFSVALAQYDYGIAEKSKEYSLIFKPTDSCASRGITVVQRGADESALVKAFARARENSTSGFVNVEEFVQGTEFTVEMLGDSFGNVSVYGLSKKYHTRNVDDNNKIAVKLHYNPSDVTDELYNRLANYGRACYKALGLSSSMGHLELLLKKDGTISPVELGARSSGYIASDLVDLVSGRCFLRGLRDVQRGGRVEDGVLSRGALSSMYYFYDLPPDSVGRRKSSILPYLRPFARSLFHDRSAIVRGKVFNRLKADTDRYGYEVLVGEKHAFTFEAVCEAERKFLHDFIGQDPANLDLRIPLFDSIVHPTINGDWLNVRFNGLAGIDELSKDMDEYNVVGAFAVGMQEVASYNEADFVHFCRCEPRLLPVAYWDPSRPSSDLVVMKSLGYKGVKIHPRLSGMPIDDDRIMVSIKEANRLGLAVLCCSFDGVTQHFADQTRDANMVLLHCGYKDFINTYHLMGRGHPGVILDLSYTWYYAGTDVRRVTDAIKEQPTRFCIGSDHPEINHRQLREFLSVNGASLSVDERNALFHGNIESFIRRSIHA